jgi:uncharacterized membrane protein
MREFMLFLHFIGLTMGIGTSFSYMFLGMASSKMEAKEGLKFTLNTLALSKMGYIGLSLLVISGFYLITPFWSVLAASPFLIIKLSLVLLLFVWVGIIGNLAARAKKGNPEIYLKKIQLFSRLSLMTSLAIVIFAILTFR